MKTKELKNKIKDSFNDQTPNNLNIIQGKCENTFQLAKQENTKNKSFVKVLAFTMCAALVFSLGAVIGNYGPKITAMAAETSIYLDVNPSVEIKINRHHRVSECVANNEDGEKILESMKLKGVEINTALYAIVGSMYTNGYLNEDANSILVSVQHKKGPEEIVLDDLTNQINNVFKDNCDMDCSIIAQKIEKHEQLKAEAEQLGISVGKLKLIKKIIEADELYTDDDTSSLAQMSIQELNLIYQTLVMEEDTLPPVDENGNQIVGDNKPSKDEVVTGKPNGFVNKEEALAIALDSCEITMDDIQEYEVVALYSHKEFDKKHMIYLVSFLRKDSTEYENYVVDCKSGEVLDKEFVNEWEDKINEKDDNRHHDWDKDDDYHQEEPGHHGQH